MENKGNSQTKARLIVLSVFAIGVVAGALGLNLYQRLMNTARPETKPQHSVESILLRLDDRLKFSPQQKVQIREVLGQTTNKYQQIRKDMDPCLKDFEPRFDAVRQESRNRIRGLLNPEQLPKFEEYVAERDRLREQEKEDARK